jgi:hypothetical protein
MSSAPEHLAPRWVANLVWWALRLSLLALCAQYITLRRALTPPAAWYAHQALMLEFTSDCVLVLLCGLACVHWLAPRLERRLVTPEYGWESTEPPWPRLSFSLLQYVSAVLGLAAGFPLMEARMTWWYGAEPLASIPWAHALGVTAYLVQVGVLGTLAGAGLYRGLDPKQRHPAAEAACVFASVALVAFSGLFAGLGFLFLTWVAFGSYWK